MTEDEYREQISELQLKLAQYEKELKDFAVLSVQVLSLSSMLGEIIRESNDSAAKLKAIIVYTANLNTLSMLTKKIKVNIEDQDGRDQTG